MPGLDTIVSILQSHGSIILFPLAIVEGPIVTVVAAFVASQGYLSLAAVYLVVVAADLVGDVLFYLVGRHGKELLLDRWGHYVGITPERLLALEQHFDQHGGKTLLIAKVTHSLGFAVLLAAGASRMHFGMFVWYNIVGTLPKSLFFLLVGYVLGYAYLQIELVYCRLFAAGRRRRRDRVVLLAHAQEGLTMTVRDTARAAGVSCVIPAYNEADRIARVLSAVVGHPLVSEVLVVDDGSTDDTAACVAGIDGVRLIARRANGGKCRALRVGIEAAAGPLILLLDADLVGLTARHVTSLIRPVLLDRADLSISLRENTMKLWRLIGLDYISGERVFHKRLLDGCYDEIDALPRFGFEVFLNELCIGRQDRVAIVDWKDVESPFKYRKYGLLSGAWGDARMMVDVVTAVSPLHLVRQIPALRRLRVTPPGEIGETDLALNSGEG